jgi:hypothetical protein
VPPATRKLAAGPCKAAVVLALLSLTACAARPAGSDAGASRDGSPPSANDLVVVLDRGDGSAVQRWTLSCAGTVEGTHPAARAACDHLRSVDDPFAPIPDDTMCTQQYDGPQTAHVTGRWGGEPVDVRLARTDGCRIAQWDGLGPLLPT